MDDSVLYEWWRREVREGEEATMEEIRRIYDECLDLDPLSYITSGDTIPTSEQIEVMKPRQGSTTAYMGTRYTLKDLVEWFQLSEIDRLEKQANDEYLMSEYKRLTREFDLEGWK